MEMLIRGEKIKITPAIKKYTHEKLGKLDKYFDNPEEIKSNVLAKIRGEEQIVEVTIPIKHAILRAEEKSEDLYAAIDLVIEKLERQIRKNKTKFLKRKQKEKWPELNLDFSVKSSEIDKKKVVKEKLIETKPMSKEEAILQMELLDHDFFVYKDEKTLEIAVIYKRRDSNYGILHTK